MKKPLVIATFLVLGGCAAPYRETSLSANHPANPAAEPALPPARSQTLDLAAAEPLAATQASRGNEHDSRGPGGGAPPGTAAVFACPMHPEVTSDKADQRCPKCGMKLVKRAESGEPR